MTRESFRLLGVIPALLLIGARVSAAQLPQQRSVASRGSATIDGIVSDTMLTPLHAAFVSFVGTPLRVGTGQNGRFRITKVPAGQYLVVVRRVGYRPTSHVVDVPAGDTVRLSYTLQPVVQELATVTVTEKPFSLRLGEFAARRRAGVGEFMTQEQIEARNVVYSTELFRNFTSIDVSPNRNNSVMPQWYALSRREGGLSADGYCPMAIYLDQVLLPTPFNLDLLPSPKDLAAIEVYAGPSTVPPQFAGFNRGCGVILLWTRDGSYAP